jgi:hypothetical protein
MIVCLLMLMVRDDCLFVDGNGNNHLSPLTSTKKQSSHDHHQQTNNHLSPLPSTNKQSSLTINSNNQTIISHHYHQQTIISHHYHQEMTDCLLTLMVRDDCLFVDGNGER